MPDAGLLGSSVSKLVSLGTVRLQPSNDHVPYAIPLENSSCNVSNPTSVPEAKSIVVVVIWKRRQRCKFGASRGCRTCSSASVLLMHDIIRLVHRSHDGRTELSRRRPDSRCVEHIITTSRDGVADEERTRTVCVCVCGILNMHECTGNGT